MPSDPIWSQLILQLVLILINAFFAGTEIAMLSLNENKLRRQSEEGDAKAGKLLKMVGQPAGFLSTIQVGITLAGFLGSAFAADNFASKFVNWLVHDLGFTLIPEKVVNTLAVILITIILSYFTLVLGELVPKRVAMHNPEGFARAVCGVIGALATVMRPIIWLLTVSTNGVLHLFGISPHDEEEEVTEEEIRLMVDIGEEKGTIESDEKEMIENIFEFNNMSAADVMTHRTDMAAIDVNDEAAIVLQTIQETGLSRFPVYEEDIDDIIGIVNTREYLLNAMTYNPKPLKELLRPAYLVPESVRADVLFRDMQTKKIHMAIVLDEYGGTSGLVTMEDLLEEIVGNIYDEFDPQDEQDILQLEPNLWRVSGSVDLKTLADELDFELSEEDEDEYDKLGGLVFAQLAVIPEDGSCPEVDVCGLHIKVQEITDRRVEWTLVSKLEPEKDKEEDGQEEGEDEKDRFRDKSREKEKEKKSDHSRKKDENGSSADK